MILKIIGVRDAGTLARERLVLRAEASGNAGDYFILRTESYDDGRPLSGPTRAAFWMPDFEISENDLLVIYTKSGGHSSKTNDKGRTTYFYYWFQNQTIWSDRSAAVVARVSAFNFHPIGQLRGEEEED